MRVARSRRRFYFSASLFSDPEFALRTRVSSLRAAGASARGEQLVAWVEARGSLLLEPK